MNVARSSWIAQNAGAVVCGMWGRLGCGRLGWLRSDTGCQRITRERIEEYLAATATLS